MIAPGIVSEEDVLEFATMPSTHMGGLYPALKLHLKKIRIAEKDSGSPFLSLAFMHIPFPKYAGDDLSISGGKRREPTEGPSINTHLYDALVQEEVSAVGCGHDHVNDFCALLPKSQRGQLVEGDNQSKDTRVWEIDANKGEGELKTWKRIKYSGDRFEELVLVEGGQVTDPSASLDTEKPCTIL
ncbi:Putative metallo-dependent phosphatase [Colletotrichum destructivum]|uniref:Metallo-dependent phosphatase n=1 Tax=Colletotrichum destructivum TaxID=34406 RepID=A0AAX4IKU1_9PEZI|nr:Putative metallo-dependent phosphatase [Colletotrichum destructivum]